MRSEKVKSSRAKANELARFWRRRRKARDDQIHFSRIYFRRRALSRARFRSLAGADDAFRSGRSVLMRHMTRRRLCKESGFSTTRSPREC